MNTKDKTSTEETKQERTIAARFPLAQLILHNPVMQDTPECRALYAAKLREYAEQAGRCGWYETAELTACEKLLGQGSGGSQKMEFSHYRYFLLLDTIFVLGGRLTQREAGWLLTAYRQSGFAQNRQAARAAESLLNAFTRKPVRLDGLIRKPELSNEREYLRLLRKNRQFQSKKPYTLLVTATMSAGKSTFINALTGKKLCRSRVEACTGKIHTIYNKAFEDGLAYEYDHELVLTAGDDELMNDNEQNRSDSIAVAARFEGRLENTRLVISDSPGVNFSGSVEHRDITRRMLRQRSYDMLIYVMNATQLATHDEDEHLDFVRNTVGRTPVLFVLNKVDELDPEKESLADIVHEMQQYLEEKGFRAPLICPVSAWLGWTAKNMEREPLSEQDKLRLLIGAHLLEKLDVPGYYKRAFPGLLRSKCSSEQERLLRASGITYIEKIIMKTGRN